MLISKRIRGKKWAKAGLYWLILCLIAYTHSKQSVFGLFPSLDIDRLNSSEPDFSLLRTTSLLSFSLLFDLNAVLSASKAFKATPTAVLYSTWLLVFSGAEAYVGLAVWTVERYTVGLVLGWHWWRGKSLWEGLLTVWKLHGWLVPMLVVGYRAHSLGFSLSKYLISCLCSIWLPVGVCLLQYFLSCVPLLYLSLTLPSQLACITPVPAHCSLRFHRELLSSSTGILAYAAGALIGARGWLWAVECLFGPSNWLVDCWFRLLIVTAGCNLQYQVYERNMRDSHNMTHDWAAGLISLYFFENLIAVLG